MSIRKKENSGEELDSNSPEGHKVLKLEALLPNPEIPRAAIDKVFKAFENVTQTEFLKVRWQAIKRAQLIQNERR